LQSQKLDPAADLNLGAEFSVMPKLNLWIQMNNLLNNKYQRWNQYEVLGFNVLGGVVYSFK
jgi:outer membrane cobalamin receptor